MHLFCIVSYAFLIATVIAKPSASTPNADEYPYDYYDDPGYDPALEPNSEDSSLLPTLITKPRTVIVKEGQSTVLDCKTKNAENFVPVWLKDKEPITQGTVSLNEDLYRVLDNNSLVVNYMKPVLAGQYACVIIITANKNISVTHRLKLENAVEIISLHAENNITQLYTGDTLFLTCEVNGKPIPNIKWYFDQNGVEGAIEIQTDDHQKTLDKDTLIIRNVTFRNNGTYRCFADNKISADHQSIVIEVFDKGRDEASKSDSRVSKGLQLAPSIALFITTVVLMNP